MKNSIKKLFSIVLCILTVFSLASCNAKNTEEQTTGETKPQSVQSVYTETPGSVKKSETVYINTDCTGAVTGVIVSDWLHTDKSGVQVKDRSDLTGIINVKGDEIPQINGEDLVWNMDTTDLYYRGTSSKQLPVSISVKYYLEGNEISASDLAGKSGSVKIEIKMKNNISETININGNDVVVCNPIFVAGGMILPESQFTNITVSDGSAISDGSKQIVAIAGLPGVSETMGLDDYGVTLDTIDFPETFTVSADVTDFTLGNMYFAAIPLSAVTSGIELPGDVEQLEGTFSELKSLLSMVYEINPQQLIDLISNNQGNIKELVNAITKASKLYSENRELISVLKKYMTKENMASVSKLIEDLQDTDLKQYAELLKNPLFKSFFSDLLNIAGDMDTLMPVIEAMKSDLKDPQVAAAVEKLPETLGTLSAVIGSVEDNQELLDAIFTLASEDNVSLLEKIINEVSGTELDELLENFDMLSGVAEDVVARFNAMAKLGDSYNIYSAAAQDAQTSLAYIYRLDSVTKK